MSAAPGVWSRLVGQSRAIDSLRTAAGGHGMTHAWLFTGPPGSGRSNAAIAFAAALLCTAPDGPGGPGCGECQACRTVLAGTHSDVSRFTTQRIVFGVETARDMVKKGALTPVTASRQIMVVEDADRFSERAGNAVLKAIEEPHPRTVWLLCAPTVEDVLPTIRSRCRQVNLVTPSTADVADFLVRTADVDPSLAAYAARASQGHVGRARALALDEPARNRRREVVSIPARLRDVGSAVQAAANLHEMAKEEAQAITEVLDAKEKEDLDASYGVEQRGRRPREYAPALKALGEEQKARARRMVIDVVDRGLMDLASVYRDAVALSWQAPGALVNEEVRGDVKTVARQSTPALNLRRIDAIFAAREQMTEFNVPPLLALEAMMVALQVPEEAR
ncbi:MAG: DNA polymerase III subunit delta' [Nocardioides sp.]|nr:DNA polymerase III subunit delta' [Nocardioides sp.]